MNKKQSIKNFIPISTINKAQSPVLSPSSNNHVHFSSSLSQQNLFKREERISTITSRKLLSSQSIATVPISPKFSNANLRKIPQIIEKQKQIDSLKTEVRVISSKLHHLKTERLNPSQLTEQITCETIKGLNLNLAKKNHLINKIKKIVLEFQTQAKQKNIEISFQCKCRMQQILSSISKNQKNVLVRQTIQEKNLIIPQNKIVVIYREDGCEQDWRVWKDKYQESQRRINQLNYQIERLYEHQNELIRQRSSAIQQRSIMEIKIKNLTIDLNKISFFNHTNDTKNKKAQMEKQIILKHKQDLLKHNIQLKSKIVQYQIKENNFKSQIKMLNEQLQDYKKNILIFNQWRAQHEKKTQEKSQSLQKMLWQAQFKMKNMNKDKIQINSLNINLQKVNCKVKQLQLIKKHLQDEKSQLIGRNQTLIYQTQSKILQINKEKQTLLQQVKSYEFKVRNLQEELEIQKKIQNAFVPNSKIQNNHQVDLLRRKINEYQLQINKIKTQTLQYQIYQEALRKNKETIKKLEEKLIQNALDLQAYDMLKPKMLKYQQNISKLKFQIQTLQQKKDINFNQKLFSDHNIQNTTTFESQFFKESDIMQNPSKDSKYILNLQSKIEQYENQLNQLKNQNSVYKSRVYDNDKSINNYSLAQIIENHSQLNEIIETNKKTIFNLETMVKDYDKQLKILKETNKIYEMKFQEKFIQNPQILEARALNYEELQGAISKINKLNTRLNELYAEKNSLITKMSSKEISEMEIKKYQTRVYAIDEEKIKIVRQFQSIRYQLFAQIRQKDQIIKKLQYQIDHKNPHGNQDQFFRYKADPRYLQLKKKLFELQQSYNTHNESTYEFFHQYRKEHLESHEKVLDLIRQTFSTLKKFEQTVIIRKSKLKRFNMQKLKELQIRIGQLKTDNLKLRQECYESLNKDFQQMRQNITNYIENSV